MTEKRKTVCVGRYLIDVPAQAEVSLSGVVLDGFDIETREESEQAFLERVRAHELEISERGTAADGNGGIVEARDLRVPGMVGRALIYGRQRSYWIERGKRVDDEWVSVEINAHIGSHSFKLLDKLADEARAATGEALLARLRARGEDEVPTSPGFCVWRGVFTEPLPSHRGEHVMMHLDLPDHPDMALTLASIAGAKAGPGLLARVAQTDATMMADVLLRMAKLREGKRSINGIDGEEVLTRAHEFNFSTTYGLNWESRGVQDDPLRPFLSLELQTGVSDRAGGQAVDTSLHEDALLALWDSISSTIRLRKNNPPPSASSPQERPGPKLGSIAHAGETCPQSGWWQCNAGSSGLDVYGGQVQFLREGERMPQALLLPRQSLWQKVKRIQPSMESAHPTAWTLVDKRQRPRTVSVVALAQPGDPVLGLELAERSQSPALGAYARTGDACPASGWWRCEESHALDGSRWFGRGSVLPAATFQVPTGVFARPGGPEFIQRRSAWQLVRFAEAPAVTQPTQANPDPRKFDEPPTLV
jgi:hypothetical protein